MVKIRELRWLETSPDNYVAFEQRQKQWEFSYRHPVLWKLYRLAARMRCRVLGHEYSPCWDEEKFDLQNLGRMTTHCLFCGKGKSQ